jgi:hypothetical protein
MPHKSLQQTVTLNHTLVRLRSVMSALEWQIRMPILHHSHKTCHLQTRISGETKTARHRVELLRPIDTATGHLHTRSRHRSALLAQGDRVIPKLAYRRMDSNSLLNYSEKLRLGRIYPPGWANRRRFTFIGHLVHGPAIHGLASFTSQGTPCSLWLCFTTPDHSIVSGVLGLACLPFMILTHLFAALESRLLYERESRRES